MRALMLLPCLLLAACGSSGKSERPNKPGVDSGSSTPSSTGPLTGTSGTGLPTTGTATGTTTPTITTGPPIQFTGPTPTNVLMISVDTTRKDHLGAYGNMGLTPYLDTLSSTGVVMDNHVQCSGWTFGSGTCTMHGRMGAEVGHMPRLGGGGTEVPAGSSPTLATVLADAGYYTMLVTGNGYMSPNWGSATGYDEWELVFGQNGLAVGQAGLDRLQGAVSRGATGTGWFLHLHYMEPHETYDPEPQHIVGLDQLDPWYYDLSEPGALLQLRGEWNGYSPQEQQLALDHMAVLYEAEMRMVDARIEWTMDQLTTAGFVDENTLVVFWTDHGEQFFEHGYQSHAYELQYGENDGALWFWNENIVPGRWPGVTSAIDVVPTVLDLVGVPAAPEMTGIPIGQAPPGRIVLADMVARAGVVQSAVDESNLKLHYNWLDGELRAFDRSTDPLETNDILDPYDADQQALWCAIEAMAVQIDPLIPESPVAPAGFRCGAGTTTTP